MEFGEVDWAVDQITTYWLCTDARIDDAANNPGCQVFNKNQPLSERLLEDRPLDPARRSDGVKHIYQQRGWIEWIESAKQEDTRQRRAHSMLKELKEGTYMPPKKHK